MSYFDVNATAPLHPEARRVWLDVADRAWHNPSSLFAAATTARDVLEDARDRLADLLDCAADRIVFTSGATAANNALARHLGRSAVTGLHAVISAVEHPCVVESFHAALPGRVVEAPVDAEGVVRPEAVEAAVDGAPDGVAIVSVMAAGNESGVLQPWREILELCGRRGIPFHTDAAQWLGKLPAKGLGGCDWVTGSGHKFGGPKGVGFLVVPEAERTFRGDRGGPQERGRHAGTENVAAIAAMVAALEARDADTAAARSARAAARDAAEARLRGGLPAAVIVSGGAERLWNTLAVVVPGADGKKLVARLAAAGIAASTGSACSTGADSPPRILAAIDAGPLGLTAKDLRGMVRLSGGWETTAADWERAIDALVVAAGPAGQPLPRVSLG